MKLFKGNPPSKGLTLVLALLFFSLGLQVYTITSVGTVEVIGNSINSDLDTIVLFVTYALTMISFMMILSDFFIMRKMESFFSTVGLQPSNENQQEAPGSVEHPVEVTKIVFPVEETPDPLDIDLTPADEEEEEEEVPDLMDNLLVSDDVEEPEEETVEEEDDQKYKVLEVKIPEDEPEEPEEEPDEPLTTSIPAFNMDHVSIDSFISEEPEPEVPEEEEDSSYFDESEILQTITEMKDVVAELKKKTGRE